LLPVSVGCQGFDLIALEVVQVHATSSILRNLELCFREDRAIGLIEVTDFDRTGWQDSTAGSQRSRRYCEQLEEGEILFFSQPPFVLPGEDCDYLRNARQTRSSHYKNISYRPEESRVKGFDSSTADHATLLRIFQSYSTRATNFVASFLAPYAADMAIDYASFRPIEEERRSLPTRLRNDLLHVDSFPTRPSHGSRILRVFTNLNPVQPRVWLTGERFDRIVDKYAEPAGLMELTHAARSPLGRLRSFSARAAQRVGLPIAARSPYDQFMHHFHHYLKANSEFQASCPKFRWMFPPMSTWLVYTDLVPHAVISGQYALEQTFIVPRRALVRPERAPITVLEQICGASLAS
jgi:3-deoxy-D-manno-oct-2-ulosonic acid (Kdo) hydroxylase